MVLILGGIVQPQSVPEVTLHEQAAVLEIGRASQTTGDLSVLLHDLHHLTHGYQDKKTTTNKSAVPMATVTLKPFTEPHKCDSLSGVQSVKSGTRRGTLSMFFK